MATVEPGRFAIVRAVHVYAVFSVSNYNRHTNTHIHNKTYNIKQAIKHYHDKAIQHSKYSSH
eukprot:545625-Karenia_brevis.AAC.1